MVYFYTKRVPMAVRTVVTLESSKVGTHFLTTNLSTCSLMSNLPPLRSSGHVKTTF
jgi:hypothetical protein